MATAGWVVSRARHGLSRTLENRALDIRGCVVKVERGDARKLIRAIDLHGHFDYNEGYYSTFPSRLTDGSGVRSFPGAKESETEPRRGPELCLQ